jgi:starch phosphorylase
VELLFFDRADDARPSRTIDLDPRGQYEANTTLREVLDFVATGDLSRGDTDLFRTLVETLLQDDPFLLLADYQAYVDCQERVSGLWRDPQAWTRMSIVNAARMGKFSSDRSIRDYCERVWHVKPGPMGP